MQVPTVTSVTLNSTIATASVSSRKGFLADFSRPLLDLLRLCPQGDRSCCICNICFTDATTKELSIAEPACLPGEICWKAAAEGPCLASTTVTSAGPGHNGSLGQASFDYATVLTPGTPFSAVALYQGSFICKSAPSDNVKEPPPKGVIMVRRL